MGRDEKCGVRWVIKSLETADRGYVGRKREESYKRQIVKKELHGPAFGGFFEMGGESHI